MLTIDRAVKFDYGSGATIIYRDEEIFITKLGNGFAVWDADEEFRIGFHSATGQSGLEAGFQWAEKISGEKIAR